VSGAGRLRAAAVVIALGAGVALPACSDSAPSSSGPTASTAPGAPAPLTMAERMVGPADGFAPAPATATGTATAVPATTPMPVDHTLLDLYFGPDLRESVVEGLITPAGGIVLRARSAPSAKALLDRFARRARMTRAQVADLPTVPGGLLVTTDTLTAAVFVDGPFVLAVRSDRGAELVAEVAGRWLQRVGGRPHAG